MTEREIINALKPAGIGTIRELKRYPGGQHNRSYYVRAVTGRYTLRIYQHKTPSEFAYELAVLRRAHGLPVPRVRRFGNQEWAHIGGKYAILYGYLPGRHRATFTRMQLHEIGAFIGAYHRRLKAFRWSGTRHRFYDLPDNRIQYLLRAVRSSPVPHQRLLPTIVRELRRCRPSSRLPQGPIHVDIKPENVLFHKGHLSGVIDFDNGYQGPLLLDLCKAMAWFGTIRGRFSPNVAADLLEGYLRRRPLNMLERKSLMATLSFAFLGHVFVDYYMRVRRYTSAKYFRNIVTDLYVGHLDMVKQYAVVARELDRIMMLHA